MKLNENPIKKIIVHVSLICFLLLGLGITTYALNYYKVSIQENYFHTGIVKINLNGGKPIITENEYKFEPGMIVVKDFYVKNESTESIYYKLYFTEMKGQLKDIVEITIKDQDLILYQGKMSDLEKHHVKTVEKPLKVDEVKELIIVFHYPESSSNEIQETELSFIVEAEAVQTRNNPNGLFE